ncbi:MULTISPECIES: TetR/AcrR family transcriptional regulator [Micrococcales]|uniref:TetR/AcrR family transcriptional regulator n=1 Tax=Actinomycetes TaxID=1760 RepID=UPI0025E44075|nr:MULTISPECIES: TetR family transcriptional regulator [unclassified Microbacterium]
MDRRGAVLDAVERLVLREGVHAVSMRAVAKEAGVSLRLVQYYGSSKAELLDGALARLSERSTADWRERMGRAESVRGVLAAFIDAALPVDEQRRAFHRFGVSLEQLALTGEDGAGRFYTAHIGVVVAALASALNAHLDAPGAQRVAESAVAFSHGLGTLVMAGLVAADRAGALITDYLDQVEAASED